MKDAHENPQMAELREEIAAYRAKHGMSKTAFGWWARKDPNLIRDIEGGRELRWQTIAQIRDKMEAGQ